MNAKDIINTIYNFGVIAEMFWKMIFLILSLFFVSMMMKEAGKWDLAIELTISILVILYLFKILFDLMKGGEFL